MAKSVSMRVPGPLAAQAKKVAEEQGLSDTAALQLVFERANFAHQPSPSIPTDQTHEEWNIARG
jgi:antitoxin component of RelBE/YafQ-DinJ toxin-antitoxin module